MSAGPTLPGSGPGHDNCPSGSEDMDSAPGARFGVTASLPSASSQAVIANVFRPQRQRIEQSSQPRSQRCSNVVLSSSTLEPIPQQSVHLAHLSVAQEIPSLTRLTLEPASGAGVYGWGPPSGPIGCKFFVFLKHVSQLAVAFLDSQHSNSTSFWINFGGTKVPCVSHKFYFTNQRDSEFGEDREVLLALVPESTTREVDVFLYVETDRGVTKFNLPLGKFKYDDQVPLKKYGEHKWGGEDLVTFLERGRPEDEDVRVPKIYLASELIGELLPHHKNIPQPSNHPEAIPSDRPKRRSKPARRLASTPSSASSSSTPSAPTRQPSPDPSPDSKRGKSSSPTSQVRRKHVTVHFADPQPSAFGWPSWVPWTSEEIAAKRRLVAISCTSNHSNGSATFYSTAVPTAQSCPDNSKLISCIYVPAGSTKLSNTCIITSVDFINLLEWMIGDSLKFDVNERNRVRRNIEIFEPVTLHKGEHTGSWDLFSQIVGYNNPRPWNIAKTFKVFKWHHVEDMVREMVKKYIVVGGEHMKFSDEDDFENELESAKAALMREMNREANISQGQEQIEYSQWQDLNEGAQGSLGQAGVGTSLGTTNFGRQTTIGEVGCNYGFTAGDALSASSAQMPMDQPWYNQSSNSSQVSQVAGGLDGAIQNWGQMNYNNNSPFANSSFLDMVTSTSQALYSFTNQDFSGAGINETQSTSSGVQQRQTPHDILSQMTYARTDDGVATEHAQPGHPHQWEQENATQDLAHDMHFNPEAEELAGAVEDFLIDDLPEEKSKD